MANENQFRDPTKMIRLIDANALLRRMNKRREDFADGWKTFDAMPDGAKCKYEENLWCALTVEDAPTVDAVEVKCKVGDLVYALWEAPVKQKFIIYCAEVKEIRIGKRNCRLTTTYRLEPIVYRGHIHEYRDEDFGKLVFLSEKEAESALAKMDGDGNA